MKRFGALVALSSMLVPFVPARADTAPASPHAAPPPAAAGPARPSFLAWTEAGPTDALRLDWPGDGIVTVGALVLWGGSQLLRGSIAPKHCNLCGGPDNTGLPSDPGAGQADLNGVDAYFHDHLTGWLVSRKSADTISNVLGYGLVPVGGGLAALAFTGPHASANAGPRALVIAAESVAITGFLGQAFKFGLARKRPFVRYGHGTDGSTDAEGSTYDVNDPESHFSFPSGHTSVTAAVTVSAAMCASLQDSSAAPYLWGAAGALTVTVATLRMMAEKHYFTDVVTGALLGAATGVVVPLLHRPGSLLGGDVQTAPAHLSVGATNNSAYFSFGGTF